MRLKCPLCESSRRNESWGLDFAIPDGWSLPQHNKVCCCANCGFVYYDNSGTQQDYDAYYQERYAFGIGTPQNYRRLDGLAKQIGATIPQGTKIADFGGGTVIWRSA